MTATSTPVLVAPPRCGICDTRAIFTECAWCHEPVCHEHVRTVGDGPSREVICAACAIEGPARVAGTLREEGSR